MAVSLSPSPHLPQTLVWLLLPLLGGLAPLPSNLWFCLLSAGGHPWSGLPVPDLQPAGQSRIPGGPRACPSFSVPGWASRKKWAGAQELKNTFLSCELRRVPGRPGEQAEADRPTAGVGGGVGHGQSARGSGLDLESLNGLLFWRREQRCLGGNRHSGSCLRCLFYGLPPFRPCVHSASIISG